MDESSAHLLETMEMIPIGKIEEVAKKELRDQRRYNSIGRSNERRPWQEDSQYQGRPQQHHEEFERHERGPTNRADTGYGRGGNRPPQKDYASNRW